jgi:hypothetical protein
MKVLSALIASTVFTLGVSASLSAVAGENISVINSGVAVANTRAQPTLPAFASWCEASGAPFCVPTTQFPVYDTITGEQKGMAYIWGAFPFNAGTGAFSGSICFSEFMEFVFPEGKLYLRTAKNGTCGAFIDPALLPPKYPELGATAVVVGGGDGVIAGGTGKYKNWSGTFTDRVFVGFGAPTSGVGGIIYYDQLMFQIVRK